MCNHLNLKILVHIFTIIHLIMIIIIMRDENFVAHRCAAEHWLRITDVRYRTTRRPIQMSGNSVPYSITSLSGYQMKIVLPAKDSLS
jgi:hypothetical protein